MQLTESYDSLSPLLDVLAGLQHGRSVDEVASELRISPDALGCWIKSLDILASLNQARPACSETVEQQELRRLRMENEYLRKQRDQYRRACGIVPPAAMSSGLRSKPVD